MDGDQVVYPNAHPPLTIWLLAPGGELPPVLAIDQAQQHLIFLGAVGQAHDLRLLIGIPGAPELSAGPRTASGVQTPSPDAWSLTTMLLDPFRWLERSLTHRTHILTVPSVKPVKATSTWQEKPSQNSSFFTNGGCRRVPHAHTGQVVATSQQGLLSEVSRQVHRYASQICICGNRWHQGPCPQPPG